MKHLKTIFACMLMAVLSVGQMWAADVIDNAATSANCSSTATSSWVTNFSISGTSGAEYYIKTMGTKSTSNALQWNANGFLNQTTSGGTLKSITIKGTSGKSIDIFAANSAYSTSAPTGTAVATLALTGPSSDATYTFTSDYTYFALKGKASSTQIVSITIEYKSGGGDPVSVTGVSLSKNATSIEVGASETLTPTITPANATNQNVTWTSSNTSVATVDDGAVTAVAVGNTNITVTTEDGSFSDVCAVTVTAAQPKITITQGDITSFTNTYAQYTWTAGGVSGKLYAYKNGGMQFNSSKDGYYVYNTDPIPGKIRKITMTKASGTTRSWTPYVSTSAMTSTEGGTALTAQNVETTTSWDVTGNNSYFYLTVAGGSTVISSIVITYEEAAATQVATPEISGTDNFYPETTVSISCGTDGATIYYTTDGSNPASSSTKSTYSAPFTLDATKTVKAIAVKSGLDNSEVASKTFTKLEPLSTMQAIFSAATSTETNQVITFSSDWVVTGISTNGKNAYLTDGTNGMILFNNSATDQSPVGGLAVGNTLSGTVTRSLKLYGGAAELVGFTAEGLTKGTGTIPNVNVLDASAIGNLSGVNTGSLVKISGKCLNESSKYYIKYGSGDNDRMQVYNGIYAFGDLTPNANYECTGVYVQYNATKEILPRSAADLVQEQEKSQAETYWDGAASGSLSIRANETIENLWSTASTGTKHFSSSNESVATITSNGDIIIVGAGSAMLTYTTDANDTYYAGTATLTVEVKAALPAGATEFEWVASTLGESDVEITTVTANDSPIKITFAKETASNVPKYYKSDHTARFYTNGSVTISAEATGKLISEIAFGTALSMSANTGIYDNGTWSGLAKAVVFTATATCKISTINVLYADGTETTLSIDNVALKTTDNPFTIEPTCNVNPIPAIVYSGYDENVATIENGVITPVAEGATTVTAKIAQCSNYSAAETTFTITVSEKQMPTLSFAEEEYTGYIGRTFDAPELTKSADVAITYSSGNTSVAEVDASTGAITIKQAEGSTVITATSTETETYASATAQYTLNVIDPNKDVLTAAAIGVSTYGTGWSDKTFTSGVKFAGLTTAGTGATQGGAIQMKAKDNSGIVTTSSIGYLKYISATRQDGSNKLAIYGKATAYESAADLYDENKQGTLIGYITSGEITFESDITYADNYKYIGILANGGAVYYSDITIKWTPVTFEKYSVTYQPGEGSGDNVVVSNIEQGTTIQLAAKPEGFTYDADHVFAGWKLNGEGDMLQAGDDYEVNANVTFIAQWSAAYTITYKAGEGSGSDVLVNNVPAGAYELAECTFTAPEGKIFAGWKLNGEGETLSAGASYEVAGSVEFVAQWTTATVVAFVAGTDKSDETTLKKGGISIAASTFSNDSYYQCYSGANMTISSEVGEIIRIELTCTGSGTSNYGPSKFNFEGYSYSEYVGTWAGTPAEEVAFGASTAQVRMTQIVVTYVPNGNVPKTEAGLAYATTEYTITVGDEFETPRLTNPHDVQVTYAGNNDQLATVDATTGALTLVEGAAGEITVTATFEGNDQY